MIVQHESCPYCNSRLLKESATCPQCNGPLGKTVVEYIEQYKDVDTLYKWTGDLFDVHYAIKYKDGTRKVTKFDIRDLMFRYRNSSIEVGNYIFRQLCIRFDVDPMQLQNFRIIDLNDHRNYSLVK